MGERAKDESSEDQALLKFLAIKDRKSRAVGSHSVPVKGVGDGYAVQRVVRTLDEWGRTSVVLRSDGENSISELKRKVKAGREEQTMIEATPRGTATPTETRNNARGRSPGALEYLK